MLFLTTWKEGKVNGVVRLWWLAAGAGAGAGGAGHCQVDCS